MKRLLIILLPLLVVSCSEVDGGDGRNDWEEGNLFGEVKMITDSIYAAEEKSGEIVIVELKKYSISQFDSKGKMIEEKEYNSEGEQLRITKYQHDDQGNRTVYNSDGELIYKSKYHYDSKGNTIEEDMYDSEGELGRQIKSQYDSDSKLIEKVSYGRDGELTGQFKYQYDSKGNMRESTSYFPDGRIMLVKYGNKGNMIEMAHYDADGMLKEERTYQYEFDETDNWIKQTAVYSEDYKKIIIREIEFY